MVLRASPWAGPRSHILPLPQSVHSKPPPPELHTAGGGGLRDTVAGIHIPCLYRTSVPGGRTARRVLFEERSRWLSPGIVSAAPDSCPVIGTLFSSHSGSFASSNSPISRHSFIQSTASITVDKINIAKSMHDVKHYLDYILNFFRHS